MGLDFRSAHGLATDRSFHDDHVAVLPPLTPDDLAGDERRFARSEKGDGVGDLFRFRASFQRNGGNKRGLFVCAPTSRSNIAVSVGPGATALTRTPNAAASRAADFVSPSTACLLAV